MRTYLQLLLTPIKQSYNLNVTTPGRYPRFEQFPLEVTWVTGDEHVIPSTGALTFFIKVIASLHLHYYFYLAVVVPIGEWTLSITCSRIVPNPAQYKPHVTYLITGTL